MARWDERNCQSFETAARGIEPGFSRRSNRLATASQSQWLPCPPHPRVSGFLVHGIPESVASLSTASQSQWLPCPRHPRVSGFLVHGIPESVASLSVASLSTCHFQTCFIWLAVAVWSRAEVRSWRICEVSRTTCLDLSDTSLAGVVSAFVVVGGSGKRAEPGPTYVSAPWSVSNPASATVYLLASSSPT